MSKRRYWTQEELHYLQDNWGTMSIKGIAKKMKRTDSAVQQKAYRIGLDDARNHFDGITISQLSKVLNTHYGILKNWINLYRFPARRKRFRTNDQTWVVTYQDFWIWAEKNKHMIDFTRIERLILGPEPSWVDEKRRADELRKIHVPLPHNTPWSIDDDARLKWLLRQFKYSYPEIAGELRRTEGAVKRRILDLGLKERPVRLPNHNKYTVEEEQLLTDLLQKGYCFEEIGRRLKRSANGVRGKAERMGYKFKNGVPYLESEGVS